MIDSKIRKVVFSTSLKAGRELYSRFDKFDRGEIRFKSGHEILTQADLASEKIITQEIKKNFPDHRILSEESGDTRKKSDYLWVVDPLDGTTNFSMHNPLWSVSIGLAYKQDIVLGIIYAPFLGELFWAEKGKGAKLYSPAEKKTSKKIKVSPNKGEQGILNTFCHGSEEKEIRRALKYYKRQKLSHLDCRQLGSAAIELAFVASGRVESLVIPGAHPWDVAGGVLLVREAGGRVSDAKGEDWSLESRDMLASNSHVHDLILKALN